MLLRGFDAGGHAKALCCRSNRRIDVQTCVCAAKLRPSLKHFEGKSPQTVSCLRAEDFSNTPAQSFSGCVFMGELQDVLTRIYKPLMPFIIPYAILILKQIIFKIIYDPSGNPSCFQKTYLTMKAEERADCAVR
jgi:hypothetical protein